MWPHTYSLLLTKNPKRYLSLNLPVNVVVELTHKHKTVVIEPILESKLEEFTEAIMEIPSSSIYIGHDNY